MRAEMGDISQVVFRLDLDKTASGWRKDVGSLVDLGFHAVDFMRALFGDVHLISSTLFDSQGHPCRDRIDAEAHLLFKVESGAFLRVIVRAGVEKKCELLEVQSRTHQLRADRASLKLTRNDGTVIKSGEFDSGWDTAMDAQLRAFVKRVRSALGGDDRLELSTMFGLITMRLIEEIHVATTVT
jgi:predicted dehydrogenase